MSNQKGLEVNQEAPNFALNDHKKKSFHLSGYKDRRVLLSFHPLAWTSVCAQQMKDLEANHDIFKQLNAVAVGVSIDTVPSKEAWAKSLGISRIPLLSDFWPHGKTAKLYNIFREDDGFSERANIVINEDGKIIFFKIYDLHQLPDINEVIKFLKA